MRFPDLLRETEPGDALLLLNEGREGEIVVEHSRRRNAVWHEVVTDSNTRFHVVRGKWVFMTDDDLEPIPDVDDALPAVMSVMDVEPEGDEVRVTVEPDELPGPDEIREMGLLVE